MTMNPHAHSDLHVADEEDLDPAIVVRLGEMDKDVAYAVQRFTIPLVPIKAVVDATEAMKTARALSQAVVLTGAKGVGKTYAVRYVRRAILAAEGKALDLNPADHPITRVLYVKRLTGRTVRECALTMIHSLVKGFRDRELGVRIDDDTLIGRLSALLALKHYHVIIIDEMETATEAGIELARRLLPSGGEGEGSDDGESTETPRRALLLVGTQALADALAGTDDVNGRWARFVAVDGLTAEEAATAYETIFPGFSAAIADMGREQWLNLLRTQVVRARQLSMRQITNHCRWYFATLYEASRKHSHSREQMILERETTPFDLERFIYCFNALNKETPRVARISPKAKRGSGGSSQSGQAVA